MNYLDNTKVLTGNIENITLNAEDTGDSGFSSINIKFKTLSVVDESKEYDIVVLPFFSVIPEFIIPKWIRENKKHVITLKVHKRGNDYYCYEQNFWRSVENVKED